MVKKEILEDLESQKDYPSYLSAVLENANRNKNISLFNKNIFSKRNIQKTAQDYEKLVGKIEKRTIFSPSACVEKAVHFWGTDLLILVFLFLAAGQQMLSEKEENQLILLKTTKYGRIHDAIAKIAVGGVYTFLFTVMMYATTFFVAEKMYGLGDLSRPVQSVSDFLSCPYVITVLEFLIITVLLKCLVYFLIYVLFLLFSVCARNAIGYCIRTTIILGLETVFFFTIQRVSWLSILKDVNLIAFLRSENTIGEYYNLNVLNYPVCYLHLMLSITIILMILLLTAQLRIYCKRSMIVRKKQNILRRVFTRPLGKVSHIVGNTKSLFLQEAYKLLIIQKIGFVLILVIIMKFMSYKPYHISMSDWDEYYYKQYMDYLEGEITEDRIAYINDHVEYLTMLNWEFEIYLKSEEYTGQALEKYSQELRPFSALKRVEKKMNYLLTLKKGDFFYDTGYKMLLGDKQGEKYIELFQSLLILMIIVLIPIYAIEKKMTCHVYYIQQKGEGRSLQEPKKVLL